MSLQGNSLGLELWLERSYTVNICIQTRGRLWHSCVSETLGPLDMTALISTIYNHSRLIHSPGHWPSGPPVVTLLPRACPFFLIYWSWFYPYSAASSLLHLPWNFWLNCFNSNLPFNPSICLTFTFVITKESSPWAPFLVLPTVRWLLPQFHSVLIIILLIHLPENIKI